MASDLAAFGGSSTDVSQLACQDNDYYVWPENMAVVELFCECETQWRWAVLAQGGVGMRVGLDYSAVVMLMRDVYIVEPEQRREMLEGVRVMEMAALRAWKSIS